MADNRAQAAALYQRFHGLPPDAVEYVDVGDARVPPVLVKLGTLKSLVYEPTGRSRRAGAQWEHQFGDYGYKFARGREPILATDPRGKRLYILGGSFRVTARGIVG